MIDYIVEHQNSFVYSHLFKYNIIDLLKKEVPCARLFESMIVNMPIEYVEWPQLSQFNTRMFSAYSGSMFKLRFEYKNVFPKLYEQEALAYDDRVSEQSWGSYDSYKRVVTKVISAYTKRKNQLAKVQYQLNLLCSMSEEDGKLIDAVSNSNDLAIFQTDSIKDLIDWRWQKFAKRIHMRGFFLHVLYILLTTLYICTTYLKNDFGLGPWFKDVQLLGLGVLLIYPLIYDCGQLIKQGFSQYFAQFWNYVDMFHIFGGYANIYLQFVDPTSCVAVGWYSALIMSILFKLFFFFRIQEKFSIITTMIMTCIYDLKVFMVFFTILVTFFGFCFNVLSPNP